MSPAPWTPPQKGDHVEVEFPSWIGPTKYRGTVVDVFGDKYFSMAPDSGGSLMHIDAPQPWRKLKAAGPPDLKAVLARMLCPQCGIHYSGWHLTGPDCPKIRRT